MKVIISTESICDLPKELLKELDIHYLSYHVLLGDQEKLDGEFPIQEIFDFVSSTKQLPKTSAINQFQFEEYFKDLLTRCDEVVHIGLSSELSSAYRNAVLAAEEFGGRVHVLDSRSLSGAVGIQVLFASSLAKQGLGGLEIVNRLKERINKVQCSFVIEHVDYLYKGGRCSKVAFLGANIFHICPQIIMKDGKMDAGKKYRGKYFNVVSQYIDDTLNEYSHPDLENVVLNYTSVDDESILKMVQDKLKTRGFKNIITTTAGATISSHCGPHCLGILYYNDK